MPARRSRAEGITPWCLGRNGGMDPYSSPHIIPNTNPHDPFPQSILSTTVFKGLGFRSGANNTDPNVTRRSERFGLWALHSAGRKDPAPKLQDYPSLGFRGFRVYRV